MRPLPLALVLSLLLFPPIFADLAVTPPTLIPAAGSQTEPSIASNGESYLAAWNDGRTAAGIYGTRLTTAGQPLDPTGIYLGAGNHPQVVWSGRVWLVFFHDDATTQLDVTVVDRDGVVVDTQRVIASNAYEYGTQYVASNGSRTVVAYVTLATSVLGNVAVAILDEDGTRLGTDITLPSSPLLNHGAVSVASNGDGFFVGWIIFSEGSGGLEGVRLDARGTAIDSAPIHVTSQRLLGDAPLIASDGHDYLLAARTFDQASLLRRINADGTLGAQIAQPRSELLAWTGTHYAMLTGDAARFALRSLDRDGNTIGADTTIFDSSDHQASSFVGATIGSDLLLAWSQQPIPAGAGTADVVAMNVDTRINAPFLQHVIAFTAAPQDAYSIAAGNNGFAVAWQEQSDDARRTDSYIARLDAAGVPRSVTRVEQSSQSTINPRVVWNGRDYDVAFIENHSIVAGIDGATVAAVQCASDLDLASNGDVTLLVWSDCTSGTIQGIRLRNGTPIDSVPLVISHHLSQFGTEARPRAAWNGNTFVVVWQDLAPAVTRPIPFIYAGIRAVRVTPELTPLDLQPIEITATGIDPAIASSGSESLIAYSRGGLIEARFLGNDGTVSAPITTEQSYDAHGLATVTWNHTSYFVAWQEYVPLQMNLYGARITRGGDISPRFLLAADATKPLVASGARLLMLYDRVVTAPQYGGVSRAFLHVVDPPRVRVAGR